MINLNYTIKDVAQIFVSVLTLLFFFLSFHADDYKYVDVHREDIIPIENKIHRMVASAEVFVTKTIRESEAANNIPKFDNKEPRSWEKDNISLYLLKSNNLLYWSDNLSITAAQLEQIDTVAQYMNIGNSWYVVKATKQDDYKSVILVLIKTEYPYQNEFLQNTYNPALGFTTGMDSQPVGIDEGLLILSRAGAPLFVITTDILWGQFKTSTLYRWLAVVCLLLLIILVFYDWSGWSNGAYPLLTLFFLLLTIRLLIFFSPPYFEEGIALFSPTLYAASAMLRSLGDLFFHVIFIFIFVFLQYRNRRYIIKLIDGLSGKLFYVLTFISTLGIALVANFINYIIVSLVQNSSISFELYKISSLTQYSYLSFFIIATLLAVYFLLVHLHTKVFAHKKRFTLLIVQFVSFVLVSLFFIDNFSWSYLVFVVLFFVIVILSVYYLDAPKPQFKFYTITIALFSIYTTVTLLYQMNDREIQKREVWAQNLSAERDLIAEMLLREGEEKIISDIYLFQALESQNILEHVIFDRLADHYFKGYFRKYDVDFQVCDPGQSLYLSIENEYVDCFSFFEQQRSAFGSRLPGSKYFWFMNNHSGRIWYHGEFHFKNKFTQNTVILFINLYSKLDSEAIGYPELLLDTDTRKNNNFQEYSYAKYVKGSLMSHSGSYDYSFNLDSELAKSEKESYFFSRIKTPHHVYTQDDNNVILVSQPDLHFMDIASMYSYTFVIQFFILLILLTLAGYPFGLDFTLRISYKSKFTYVLLICITLSLTLLTAAVLVFSVRQSEQKNIEIIEDKMRSIIIELDQSVIPLYANQTMPIGLVEPILVSLSNTFYTDLNLYDANGDLIASSRNEIFEKKLLGTKMNREAFSNMVLSQSSKYVHSEFIGQQKYYSAYSAYYNQYGDFVAYINLPYFFKQTEFREEILTLIAAIINIYILLILAGSGLAIIMSNQISKPLEKVRQKISLLDLTSHYETIDYKGDDELGDLVREYNRMVGELAESARKLAQSEREWAWREMARQIAHEIKNPLTPMRLSIQHLMRIKANKADGWQDKVDPLAKSLLDQIDVLSNIASEFSSFSRDNNPVLEPVNLLNTLETCCELFSGYNNIVIDVDNQGNNEKYILGNKERLQRVFTNLIKNAIQAMEADNEGRLSIKITEQNGKYKLTFEDTGSGVPEELQDRLFQPNFTTKSSGTGLGLAISKNIIQSFSGSIVYKKGNKGGACFIIEFPKNEL